MDFGQPAWLALLLLPVLWLWWRRRRRPGAILFARVDVLEKGPSLGRWTARLLVAARVAAIAGTCVALARPRTGARVEQVAGEGISIKPAIGNRAGAVAQ